MPLSHWGCTGGVLSFFGEFGMENFCLPCAGVFPQPGRNRSWLWNNESEFLTFPTEIPPGSPALLLSCFPRCFSSSSHEPKAATATGFASQPCSSWISNPWMVFQHFSNKASPSGNGNLCWQTTVLLFLGAPFVLPIIYLPLWVLLILFVLLH